MAARLLPLQSILHLFQPAVPSIRQQSSLFSSPGIQRILNPSIPRSLALPIAAFAGASDILREIWDGLLRAVPKKKTSHMKKRHRQMAGKALKDVTALSRCSACGRLKRAHVLCPYCVEAVRMFVKEMVLGQGKFNLPQAPQRAKTTYNAAETSPKIWQRIQENLKRRAERKRKEREDDKTRW